MDDGGGCDGEGCGEDAAGDEDGVGGGGDGGGGERPLPAKVRKMGLRFGSNLAMKELVEVSAGAGEGGAGGGGEGPEVVVPVM